MKALAFLSLAGTVRGNFCSTIYGSMAVEYDGKCFMFGLGTCWFDPSVQNKKMAHRHDYLVDMEPAPQSYMPAVGPLLQKQSPVWTRSHNWRPSSCCIWHRDAATEGMAYVVQNPSLMMEPLPPQQTGDCRPGYCPHSYNLQQCNQALQNAYYWYSGPFNIWDSSEAPAARPSGEITGWDPCPAQSEPTDDQIILCMTRSAPPPAPAKCAGDSEGAWVLANYPGHTVGTPPDYDNFRYDTGPTGSGMDLADHSARPRTLNPHKESQLTLMTDVSTPPGAGPVLPHDVRRARSHRYGRTLGVQRAKGR